MHRDLKLENLMVDVDGYLKVIDYGLARVLLPGQLSRSMCGTPQYMAPEVVKGEQYSFAADWWSVGVIMYEMITGFNPFGGKDRRKIF